MLRHTSSPSSFYFCRRKAPVLSQHWLVDQLPRDWSGLIRAWICWSSLSGDHFHFESVIIYWNSCRLAHGHVLLALTCLIRKANMTTYCTVVQNAAWHLWTWVQATTCYTPRMKKSLQLQMKASMPLCRLNGLVSDTPALGLVQKTCCKGLASSNNRKVQPSNLDLLEKYFIAAIIYNYNL